VANIGCGRRGLLRDLIEVKDSANIEIAAVCDSWRQKREKAALDVKEFTGKDPKQAAHYSEVLADKSIDAVVIGTPDHQHCTLLIDAIRAGKDVYVEKPLAMNMRELVRAYDTVKRSDRIVQIGTQMRSYPQSAGARELIASGGLGKVLKVEQARNGYSPYWMSYGGAAFFGQQPTEADVDWKAFLLNQKARSFDPKMYLGWYGYRDFSRGPHTNLMVHFIDLVHFVTGVTFPKRVVALGGTFRWKDQYDAPDSVEVVLEYPEGLMVRYSTVFGNGAGSYAKWFGTRGTMDAKNLSSREHWLVSGEGSGEPDKIAAESQVPENQPVHHMQNFLDSVRSRKEPIAPIEAGYAHSVAVIMADEALTTGRRMTYDHARREVHPA
jgi:predicted dehydrogenase